ncbi:dTDP-4-dehydrorhamnose reductase [Bryocella elongata]|uniref:dTDP-4-dehydrorhamnose reductase n=1 Tax=Bryocella elongata TaxID=863522 RepID=A0A1H5TQY8_9BACT|nr:dTDP-4-dehydrorhamnose reductase [Bryocella elongata]SEF65170.1 dTDP-4-dehydrorhamnose reductase [Bryocella elongata]
MQVPRPVLITGATGQVGGALVSLLRETGRPLLTPGRHDLDLSDPDSIRTYIRAHEPGWILNPAAYTQVDKAESDEASAAAINAIAPGIIGEAAASVGAGVVHFSTDYVFSGEGTIPWKEDDPKAPQNVYGATKLAGEQALAASGAPHVIFRTSWVYAAGGKNFPLTILRLAGDRAQMNIVADQIGAPTLADDLAALTLHTIVAAERGGDPGDVLRTGLGGVYHACNAGETSWCGFANEVLRLAQQCEPKKTFAKLVPIPTSDYPTPAKRPLNSRLNCHRIHKDLGFVMPTWTSGTERFISQLFPDTRRD